MKKTMRLLLILALAAALLAGCGAEPENLGGTVTPTASAPTEVPEEGGVSMGRMEGGVYTNEYAGFACRLSEDWIFYAAEELQDLPDNVAEVLEGSEIGDAMADVQQFTDMMAENANDLTNMNVLYQKQDLQTRLTMAILSEEQVIDATLGQSASIEEAYAQMGMTNISLEKVTVTFLGREHFALRTQAELQGIPVYMLQLMDYSRGAYAITTTLTSYMEDKTESMLELFYAVE